MGLDVSCDFYYLLHKVQTAVFLFDGCTSVLFLPILVFL